MEFKFYDIAFEIDELTNNFSNENLRQMEKYFVHEGIKDYFFKKLSTTNNPFPWLKPLKEKGYFDPKNNPQPQEVPDKKGHFTIPYWNILGYLENVAKKNEENPNNEITELLIEIVKDIINYRDENGNRIENYRTDWVMIKIIFSLPIQKITREHIEFIRTALNSIWNISLISSEVKETVLPKLLNNGKEAKDLLLFLLENVVLEYKKIEKDLIFEKNNYEYKSIMDEYWLKESLEKYKPQIAKLCSIEAAKIAINKIKTIVKEDRSQFNPIWIPTIENHPQTSFPDRYENQLVYFVRDMFELTEPQKIKDKIGELLNEEHPIFKRIAIHVINYHYNELNELFWGWKANPLNDFSVKHELYELFKNHAKEFSKDQIKKIISWIKDYFIPEGIKNDKEKIEKYLAYRKKEWLYSILDSENSEVLKLYEKYDKINPDKLDHPGFDFWMETKRDYESIVQIEEFLTKSNEEIAEYLINLKNKENMDIEGISNVLRNAVTENPEKFTSDMKPFLNIPRIHQYYLLWGIKNAWDQKKNINWNAIVDFITELIDFSDFWSEEFQGYNYRNWIVSQIAELIEEGTKDDNHAFEPELLPKAEKILLTLAEKTKSDLPDMLDLITSVLNSTKGKVFSAMVNYSLRYARLYKQENADRWIESIKKDFTERLNRDFEPSLEFSVILGQYLPNLYWLDKKWVIDNINKIFPKEDETYWKAAFTGYLFYSSRIYKDIYFLLRENNHYLKAIKTEFKDEHITDRLAQHISIGYLEDWESLEDEKSLIYRLIENKNKKQLLGIIDFFWMLRENINKIKHKIKPLWRRIYNVLQADQQDPENQEIISYFIKWLVLIDKIDDDIFEWIKLSVKYASKGHNATFLSEYLLKHTLKTPRKVGEIYLEMLNSGIYLDYKKENIQETVNILYKKGEKDLADRICNLYGAKGFDFLRDIYFKYNKEGKD